MWDTNDGVKFLVEAADAGLRLDRFLALRLPDFSRVRVQAAIREGGALRNGEVARPAELLEENDTVTWNAPAPKPAPMVAAEDIPLEILFEDEHLLVINKAAGMVVHPGAGHHEGTLVSALLHHCPRLADASDGARPGIVHRLDKETSGCLVVAKTDAAHASLAAQFAARTVAKTYLALTSGAPRRTFGDIEAPIARHAVHRQKMTISDRGREASTEYRVLESDEKRSLIECRPRTGRTHQIRVHLKHIGCPVLGDPVYGHRGGYDRHMLHAWKLAFDHPVTDQRIEMEAAPPPGFLDGFRKELASQL